MMSTRMKVHMVFLPIIAALLGLTIYNPSIGLFVIIWVIAVFCLIILYYLIVEAITDSIDRNR